MKVLEEPTGIWVVIVAIWPVISKVLIIPIIMLLVGYCLWALGRIVKRVKAELEDYPLFEALYLFAFLGGL
ncbi:MAG: hypothetical protein Q8N69_00340 [bacterium]|nr:hypothetical protein [bacterium]